MSNYSNGFRQQLSTLKDHKCLFCNNKMSYYNDLSYEGGSYICNKHKIFYVDLINEKISPVYRIRYRYDVNYCTTSGIYCVYYTLYKRVTITKRNHEWPTYNEISISVDNMCPQFLYNLVENKDKFEEFFEIHHKIQNINKE